ncbi:MAG: hypothetical protein H7X71_07180 [Chitinophagales bacterium]|nr:hypothetical protein [Chitinophagales bacterium]
MNNKEYHLTYIDSANRGFQNSVDTLLKNFNRITPASEYNSIISRLNSADSFLVLTRGESDFFMDILQTLQAKDLNWASVKIFNDTLFKPKNNEIFTAEAINDMYACKLIAALLEEYGVYHYRIKINAATLTKGSNFKNEPW